MPVLALNAGSSNLKFALFDEGATPSRLVGGAIEGGGVGAIDVVSTRLEAHGDVRSVSAVGHRVVMGGSSFDRPIRIDDAVLETLRALRPLDPDHMPVELGIVEAARRAFPGAAQVACFDTAFHAAMPRVARLLPLPRAYESRGLRRYGFHGLSYEYLLHELGRLGRGADRGRIVLAHLGSGASLAAVRDGRPIDTTMGFTPNSGVPMSTRSGDLDPGVIVHLQREGGLDADAVDSLLCKRSGLLGVSGVSADMRELLAREATDSGCADAVALFCHSVRKAVGALAATIDGLDTLVFSGGIGERSATVRARICDGLSHLGVVIDPARNEAGAGLVSTSASRTVVRVIATDEEAIIARHTLRLVRGGMP